ncbi:Protein FAR1-RELATED SEQUENCE 5 [Platanthera zijinensis]|uniref:Protein FAR1-RELATED SEQUENCE n=1 Tax=Platanthera zijinensis TaxID=2320716 RepID=A0AAP0B8E4_9ASPA
MYSFTPFTMTSESSNSKSMNDVVVETNTDSTEPSVKESYVSLVFESVDEAYQFYNSYALNVGFGIKKGSTSKSRVNCKAKLDIRKNKDDKWVVTGFIKEHNHELDTPMANLFTSYALERFAAEFYTKNMFKHFQQEFKQSLECWYEEINTIGTITTFRVGLSCEDAINWSTIIYDDDNTKVICECAKFETDGFLCKHILHIMIAKKHLQSIPNLYLLKRWSISDRSKSNTEISVESSDIVTPMMK